MAIYITQAYSLMLRLVLKELVIPYKLKFLAY